VSVPFWLTIPQFDKSFDATQELAARASSLGLGGVFCFDHLVPIGQPQRPVLEGAATLGAVAAISSVPVGSLVTRVTLRPPPVTAGLATTLRAICGNQAILGLGVGDRLSEDEALRYGMERPGLSERIEVLETTISLIRQNTPDLQLWVGGRHPRIREVAARLADGWNAWGATPDEFASEAAGVLAQSHRDLTISWGGGILLAASSEALTQEVANRGNSEGVIAGTPERVATRLAEIAAVADRMVVSVLPNRPANWELFTTEVLGRLT
jgi:alkanesulfonate monooxygenase SsuD/methylene tetrahydromethanopterin reductase-like flavin-dependent oxidoreductase (luciferase family)